MGTPDVRVHFLVKFGLSEITCSQNTRYYLGILKVILMLIKIPLGIRVTGHLKPATRGQFKSSHFKVVS